MNTIGNLWIQRGSTWVAVLMLAGLSAALVAPVRAADRIEGQVLAAGAPIANSTVTLWVETAGAPKQLAQVRTGANGRFEVSAAGAPSNDVSLYLIANGGTPAAHAASGDNAAIALMSVVGARAPANVVINELTTIASVWTHNQFIDGAVIKGPALSLKIAAGNVPNFVNLETGGYGTTIADALNSTETPTLANFSTLADIIAACATRTKADACEALFAAAKSPEGKMPANTLAAAEFIARSPWHQPEGIFALLDKFYPVPPGKPTMRATPFRPYLKFSPSAWVLPLRFARGGLTLGAANSCSTARATSGSPIISMVGAQNQDDFWRGTSRSSPPTVRRSRRPSPASPAAACRSRIRIGHRRPRQGVADQLRGRQ